MKNYQQLSPASRLWIYQSNRELNPYECISVKQKVEEFVSGWEAHSEKVCGFGDLYFNRFIVLIADETEVQVSGCSIDSSVNFVKAVGAEFNIDFFDRFNIAYKIGENVRSVDKQKFQQKIENGEINSETIVFNNLVNSKQEFEKKWEIPLKESWHQSVFSVSG